MGETLEIIAKVLPVIILIALGNLLQRANFLKQDTVNELKKIVVNISLPALLFMAFADTAFEGRYILIFISVFTACGLMLIFGLLLKKTFKVDNIYFPSIFSGFETGMMGYSLFVAVYGQANMHKLAIVDLGQVTFVFFILVSYLQKLNGKSATLKQLTGSFIKSPVIISIILGIIVGSLGIFEQVKSISLSNALLESVTILSDLTVPVICLVIGYELKISMKGIGRPLIAVLSRMVLLFGLAFIINTMVMDRMLHLDKTFQIALYTMFLLPPPFVIPIYMQGKEEKEKQFILNTISVSILLSLAAFLALIVIFK